MTTLRFRTAAYNYSGPGRLDVTRVGVDRARHTGKPAPGAPWAPASRLLWPAMNHLHLVAALERRAAAMPAGEAASTVALSASDLLCKIEDAYRDGYLAALRVSAGLSPERWGRWERIAYEHGVRASKSAWRTLLDGSLAGPEVAIVCFCRRREPGPGQRHTCHRHLLASALRAMGAVDLGEIEAPEGQGETRKKALPPLESLVAVSGTRPPPRGAPAEDVAAYQRIAEDVRETIHNLPKGSVVIAGKAEGVDTVAAEAAREAGHALVEYPAWFDAWEKQAPLVRNVYTMSASRLLAWPSRHSRGTHHAVGLAKAAGVEVDERRLW